jgi:hypothetical protein
MQRVVVDANVLLSFITGRIEKRRNKHGGLPYRLHIAYASRNVSFSTRARFTSK